jgi:hypothetical protein
MDEDSRDLAKHIYKALLSNSRREQGVPYYERSTKALQGAVKKLRRKRMGEFCSSRRMNGDYLRLRVYGFRFLRTACL